MKRTIPSGPFGLVSRLATFAFVAGALGLVAAVPVAGQEAAEDFLAVGAAAPDVVLTGATRYGVLREPVRLSDFRGNTVVLAFFFRARTPG